MEEEKWINGDDGWYAGRRMDSEIATAKTPMRHLSQNLPTAARQERKPLYILSAVELLCLPKSSIINHENLMRWMHTMQKGETIENVDLRKKMV